MRYPKNKQPTLNPFQLSELASEQPLYEDRGTENATDLSCCDSIELYGRIDTSSLLINILLTSNKWRLQSGCNHSTVYCCLPNFGRCCRSQDRVLINSPLVEPLYPAEWMAEKQFRTVDHPS